MSLLKSVAALHGAGRKVLVVSMDPVNEGAEWLAGDLVHVVGTPLLGAVTAPELEPPAPYEAPPPAPVPQRIPAFSDLRLFAGVFPDPIGEAAGRWQQLRQQLRWPLEEVPLPDEGAYAWFGVWPSEPNGPAALIRFQPYEFAGVQVLQLESAIGQISDANSDLERVGSPLQQRFATEVTLLCEPNVLRGDGAEAWTSDNLPAVARAIILDGEPPLPLAFGDQRIAVRMTVGTTAVYLHYLVPIATSFDTHVAAAVDAICATHRLLWELGTASQGQQTWLQGMHFASAADLTLQAAQGHTVCSACGTVGLAGDEFCGWCGARWR